MPTKNAGIFAIWGIGGIDKFTNKAKDKPEEWTDNHSHLDINSHFYPGTAAINHLYLFGTKAYINTSAAVSSYYRDQNANWMNDVITLHPWLRLNYKEFKYTLKSFVNYKISAHHTNRTGFSANIIAYDYDAWRAYRYETNISSLQKLSSNQGNSQYYHFFTQSKFDITAKLSINAGIHATYFDLNKKHHFEPRAGIKWQALKKHAFSLAYGNHSQLQTLNIYFIEKEINGNLTNINKNLDFSKAQHLVLGYDFNMTANMHLKIESYYQVLSKLPVEESTYFSIINIEEPLGFDKTLINKGEGKNYGVDITLERFLNKGYYFLFTTSLFESKYTGGDKIERNTLYNCNYVVNLLAGKEWNIKQNNLFGFSGRLYLKGGNRKTPVNYEQSIINKEVAYDYSKAYESQAPMLYRFDISANYRINKEKLSHVIALQINNALASPTLYEEIFDYKLNNVQEVIKGEPFPSVSWKIEF